MRVDNAGGRKMRLSKVCREGGTRRGSRAHFPFQSAHYQFTCTLTLRVVLTCSSLHLLIMLTLTLIIVLAHTLIVVTNTCRQHP